MLKYTDYFLQKKIIIKFVFFFFENFSLLPIECTKGGTKPASFSWDSGFDCNSIKVCSILRRVVGVNVGVVRVGTPELMPSRAMNCNNGKICVKTCCQKTTQRSPFVDVSSGLKIEI